MDKSKRKRKRKNTRSKQLTLTSFVAGTDLENQSCLSTIPTKRAKISKNIDNFQKERRRRRNRGKAKKKDNQTGSTVEESMDLNAITSINRDADKACMVSTVSLSHKKLRKTHLPLGKDMSVTDTNSMLHKSTAESKGIICNQNRKWTKRTSSFRERLQNKLESGRFRWINEKLYTSSSECATKLFEDDPGLFQVYHQGFSSQVNKWPVNPVNVIINWIKKR